MALNDPHGFQGLVDVAKTLIPRLRQIRFRKAPVYSTERELVRFGKDTVQRSSRRRYQGELILFDFEHAENVSARTASEGTMLMLGLLTVLLGPIRTADPTARRHRTRPPPAAEVKLVEVIGKRSSRNTSTQELLATSHSPYLLNYLSPGARCASWQRGPDGYARCGRLTDHPKFPTWKEEMAPGEMWSLFGEKWLADRGATS